MPLFDIEEIVKKEIRKASAVEEKMQTLVESTKIGDWCDDHYDVTMEIKDSVDDEIRYVDKYRSLLADLLRGYRTVRSAENFDEWEDDVKLACDDALKREVETEAQHHTAQRGQNERHPKEGETR